jgi:hypothetical protein
VEFHDGDVYAYINVHGVLIIWERDQGVWYPNDTGRTMFPDDEWMSEHMSSLLNEYEARSHVKWVFLCGHRETDYTRDFLPDQ